MSHIPPVSFGCLSTIPAYRIVSANTAGAQNVILPASAAVPILGITVDTVKDITNGIPVCIGGIAKLQFNDTVAAGGLVAPDGGGLGLGVPHVNITAGSYVVGVLVGPAVALTGTVADVLVNPIFKSIP